MPSNISRTLNNNISNVSIIQIKEKVNRKVQGVPQSQTAANMNFPNEVVDTFKQLIVVHLLMKLNNSIYCIFIACSAVVDERNIVAEWHSKFRRVKSSSARER